MSASSLYAKRFAHQHAHSDVSDAMLAIQIAHENAALLLDLIMDRDFNDNWTDQHIFSLAQGSMALLASVDRDLDEVDTFVAQAPRQLRNNPPSSSSHIDRTEAPAPAPEPVAPSRPANAETARPAKLTDTIETKRSALDRAAELAGHRAGFRPARPWRGVGNAAE